MAVARPVRALALAAIMMWCFFLYQIFKPSGSLPGRGDTGPIIEKDPNLDRTITLFTFDLSHAGRVSTDIATWF